MQDWWGLERQSWPEPYSGRTRTVPEIRLNGRPVKVRSPYEAIRLGIAYLPESRKEHGVLLSQSVRINTTMASLKKVRGPFDVVRQKKEKQDTREMISKLHIKTDGTEIHVGGIKRRKPAESQPGKMALWGQQSDYPG